VVRSQNWDNGAATDAGAVTWGNGTGGTVGAVGAANSLVGSTASDQVGNGGVTALANGNYVAVSNFWDNGGVANAGALTYGLGTGGTVGPITAANSVRGTVANEGLGINFSTFGTGERIVVGRPGSNHVSVFPPVLPTWNGMAWVPNAPTTTDRAFIASGSPNQPPSFVANNLTVQAGAELSLASGVTATVNGVLNYPGNITVQSGGALLQAAGSTLGTSTGTFTAQRGVPAKVGPGYNFISSPVAGATFNSIGTTPFPDSRFRHAPANAPGTRWVAMAGTDALVPGVGYTFVSNTGTSTLNFVGTPHNGALAVPLTGQSTYRYNLVGNPYPSPLRLSSLFAANSDPATGIDGTAWFWQDNNNNTGTGSYLAINNVSGPSAQAAVGQGFFVLANANSGTLNFTNAQREGGNPTFYRPEGGMERFWLAVSAQGGQDELWVAFGPQFTTGFENGYDAQKLEGAASLSLSAVVGGERLAIAALPTTGRSFELPLQLFARGAGAYTFAASEVESPTAQKLFLEDRQTGEFYYLEPGRSHPLHLSAGNHRDRFFLRSASEVVGQAGQAAGAYSFGRELFVEASETAQVMVFTTMGTEVKRFAGVQPGSLRRLPIDVPASGVYVVRVATASGSVEKRVWLEK
jgi:hypothetical protein